MYWGRDGFGGGSGLEGWGLGVEEVLPWPPYPGRWSSADTDTAILVGDF